MTRRKRSKTAREAIWLGFNKTCQMCFQLTDERGFELDHRIPLAIGGDDSDDNLHPLCRTCHRLKTKGDRTDIAKALRREANHTGTRARQPWPKPPKRPAPPQKRASTPLSKAMPPRRLV